MRAAHRAASAPIAMNTLRVLSLAASATLFASISTAQVTSSTLSIGAPGSPGCQAGTNSPLLSDGSVATGIMQIHYDASSAILTLAVDNTSPVIAASNPLVTDIYLNAPVGAVTGATLINQVGSGGANPAFTLAFDADNTTAPSLPRADCFGHFSIQLSVGGLPGGIGNAAASTFAVPASQVVRGPVTFTLQLTVNGVITASAFTEWQSWNAANVATQGGALAFGGAGANNDGAGFVGHPFQCKTAMFTRGLPRIGTTFDFCMTGPECCHLCIWASLNPGPTFFLGYRIDLGFPVIGIYDFGFLPREGLICTSIPVPNNRSAIGATVYFVNATYLSGYPAETLNVSDGLALTVVN